MILTELFNTKVSLTYTKDDRYHVRATAMIGGRKIEYLASHAGSGERERWEIIFVEHGDGMGEFGSVDITGGGEAEKVLAGAAEFIKHLAKRPEVKLIRFTASEPGANARADVYERMVKRMIKGTGFELETQGDHYERIFKLRRIE